MYNKKIIIILGLSGLLFGCGGEDKIKEIDEEINKKKQLYMTDIEPLPDFDDFSSYRYQNTDKNSPFNIVPFVPVVKQVVNSGITPDLDREKEYLEKFQLETIKMQGFIESDGSIKAILKDPLGKFHQVSIGDYVGKNYGKIENILKSEIIITELVNQAGAGWVEKQNKIVKNNTNNGFEEAQIENIKKMNE